MTTTNIDHLCGFISDDTTTEPVALPEPSLPPRERGGRPIPLSQAQAERAANERRAEARAQTSNGYPFMTKRQIKERIETDPDFAQDCLLVIYERQTDDEVAEKDTKWLNKRGFMSSHAVHGTRIAEAILAGEWIEDEDRARITAMAVRYSKQLAAHFRKVALKENPELAAQAAKFGVGSL